MNRARVCFVILLVFVATVSFSQFRETKWGMSTEEVIAVEGSDPIPVDGPPVLVYDRELIGHPTRVMYFFDEEHGLVRSHYTVNVVIENRIREELERRYGTPTAQSGMSALWIVDNTKIFLNHSVSQTLLNYSWTEFEEVEEQRKAMEDAEAPL